MPYLSSMKHCNLIGRVYVTYSYCMKIIQDESVKLCFIFHNVQSVLYFPLENTELEIVLCIRNSKPLAT